MPTNHLWGDAYGGTKMFGRFLPEDFAAEVIKCGHRIAVTVYVDAVGLFAAADRAAPSSVDTTFSLSAPPFRSRLDSGNPM
jgi:hypothetical protein